MNFRSLFLVFLFVFFAATCRAEETKSSNPIEDILNATIFSLGEIRVSGSRLSSEHSDEPATGRARNITVIGPRKIAASGARDLPAILGREEGVTVTDETGLGQNARVDLRGFGGEAKNTLVLFDGIRAVEPFDNSVTWHLFPPEFLRQVEIQRGGGSTVYGEGAFSGVIEMKTKDPTKEPSVSTEHGLGDFGTRRHFVDASGTMPGGLGFYLGAAYQRTEGYRQNAYLDAPTVLLKNTYEWSDRLRVANALYFADHETGIPGPLSAAEAASDRRQKDPDGQFGDQFLDRLLQDALTVSFWFEPLGTELSNLFGVRRRQQDSVQSFGGAFPGTSINDITTATLSDVVQGTWVLERDAFTSRLAAGLEWSKDDIHNPFVFEDRTFGPFRSERSIDRRMVGVFGRHRAELWKRLIVESGLRWDRIDWDIYDLETPSLQKRKSASNYSPMVGVELKCREWAAVYASVSESFKAPDSNALIFETPNLFAPNPDIDPQIARHYEAGLRLADPGRGSARAGIFLIETKKEILFNDLTNLNENFDTYRSGFELAGEAAAGASLQLFANYTYTDAEFDNGAFHGRQIPLTPEHRASAGGVWSVTKRLTASLQGTLVRDQFALNDFNNRFPADNYLTVDGKISYRRGGWEIYARGQNLLGEEYGSFETSNGVDTVNVNPAPELYLEAGFRYNYG